MSCKMNELCTFEVQEVEDLEKISHFVATCISKSKKRKKISIKERISNKLTLEN